jgi:hypothetical protein
MHDTPGSLAHAAPPAGNRFVARGGQLAIEAEEFRALLLAAAYQLRPICVFGQETDRHWAEVYEREAGTMAAPAQFLVRLVVLDECQHILELDDLPGLLTHLERLAPLLGPLTISTPSPAERTPVAQPRHDADG